MSGKLSKLKFLFRKSSCEKCKGQPTPPPCYNCVLKLETPPPTFTSLQGHHFFGDEDPSSLYTHTEEYTYPEDAGINIEYDEESLGEPPSPFGNDAREIVGGRPYESRFSHESYAEYGSTMDTTDTDIYNLPRAVGSIALAFLPGDQRRHHQQIVDVENNERARHPSAPVFSNHANHGAIARTSSISQLYNQDIIHLDDPETMTGSNRALMDALNLPLAQWGEQMPYDEPVSPGRASPLPCQLLIPE